MAPTGSERAAEGPECLSVADVAANMTGSPDSALPSTKLSRQGYSSKSSDPDWEIVDRIGYGFTTSRKEVSRPCSAVG